MLSLLLILPLSVPMIIATHAVIGEKLSRTLEPLLASPATTLEILVGKMLAAALPGVAISWLSYAALAAGLRPGASPSVYAFAVSPTWLVAVGLVGPATAFLAVNLGIIVSSRMTDPRAAQQAGVLLILPIIALAIGQVSGLLLLTPALMLAAAAVALALAAGTLLVAVRLFDRETILTRWK